MDVDISDILADVSRLPSSYAAGDPTTYSQLLSDPQSTHTDFQALIRAWTNERMAPSLLPYPTALMSRTMTRLREQISRIEDLTSDPTSYEGSFHANGYANTISRGKGGGASAQNLNLTLSILQTDLSRTQFLLRSLLRQRLAKLTTHAAFYLGSLDADTKKHLLSDDEVRFLRSHQALLSDLYSASFLEALPAGLRRLDDNAGGDRMVEGPDGLGAVFVRCLGEGWDNEDDGGGAGGGEGDGDGVGGEAMFKTGLRMRRGEVWVVRWRDVRQGVVAGELELL